MIPDMTKTQQAFRAIVRFAIVLFAIMLLVAIATSTFASVNWQP